MSRVKLSMSNVVNSLIVLFLLSNSVCEGKTSWWEKVTQVQQTAGANAQDFAAQLQFLGRLAPQQQIEILKQIGAELQESSGSKCNLFGGESSCMRLPEDSKFHQICPNHPLTVDCAYWSESLVEMDEDPVKNMISEMEDRGDSMCDTCVTNQQQLWCAQAVPKCGSFQKHVELALLPTLTAMALADEQDYYYYDYYEEAGSSPPSGPSSRLQKIAILAGAMPAVVKAMSLSMPCKAMCQASLNTCGCGISHTFGNLIETLEATARTDPNEPLLPPGVSKQVFSAIWDTQLCDLYADEHDDGFTGYCATGAHTATTCNWCGDTGMALFTEMQIAGMLAEELYGWVAGPMGLMDESSILEKDTEDGVLAQDLVMEATEEQLAAEEKAHHASSSNKTAVVVTVLVCLAVVGAAAAGGVFFYRQKMGLAGEGFGFSNLSGMQYSPQGNEAEYREVEYEAPGVPLIDDEPPSV